MPYKIVPIKGSSMVKVMDGSKVKAKSTTKAKAENMVKMSYLFKSKSGRK
jgi:hypothetical protein